MGLERIGWGFPDTLDSSLNFSKMPVAPQHHEAKASKRRPLCDVVVDAMCHSGLLLGMKALFLQMPEVLVADSLQLSAFFRTAWAEESCLALSHSPFLKHPCVQWLVKIKGHSLHPQQRTPLKVHLSLTVVRNGELVFSGHRVSLGDNEKLWRWMVMKMVARSCECT